MHGSVSSEVLLPLSMTGFGAAEGTVAGGTLRVEIRSVNHRFFNLAARLPSDLTALETELRNRLRKEFERGHVAVQVRWTSAPPPVAGAPVVHVARAREVVARLRELQAAAGLSGEIPLELVARQPDVFTASDGDGSAAEWPLVEPVVADAAGQCREARRREGAALARELDGRLALIREEVERVKLRAPERLARERDRLRGAVAQLLDGRPVDEQRLAQEIAFLAERLDVTEELVRLDAHLEACGEALAADGPVGKRLGFLAQELGREANTIGSKANDAVMQHAVVAMKGELERFREQIENLE
jgi:uncharacterized protein (TIGR00255 family)